MSDPLDYMNRFSQWPTPPPFDGKWAAALGRACDELAAKDAQLAAESQLKEAAEARAAGLEEAAKWGNDALRSWSTGASFSNLSAEGKKWWYQRYMETDELLAPAAEEGALAIAALDTGAGSAGGAT
jgi:hypothetical protein